MIERLKDSTISVDDRVMYFNQLYNDVRKEIGGLKESYFRDTLAERLDGETEVEVLHGFVDVMTDDKIIEVKRKRLYKQAIGQILVYGLYFEDKEKEIYLIDDLSNSNDWLIEDACYNLDIEVNYMKDPILERIKNIVGNIAFGNQDIQILSS